MGSWVALVDQLRALPSETEWVEFKRNHCEPQRLGEYLSAEDEYAPDSESESSRMEDIE